MQMVEYYKYNALFIIKQKRRAITALPNTESGLSQKAVALERAI